MGAVVECVGGSTTVTSSTTTSRWSLPLPPRLWLWLWCTPAPTSPMLGMCGPLTAAAPVRIAGAQGCRPVGCKHGYQPRRATHAPTPMGGCRPTGVPTQ